VVVNSSDSVRNPNNSHNSNPLAAPLPSRPIGNLEVMPRSAGKSTAWIIEIYGAHSASGKRLAPDSERAAK